MKNPIKYLESIIKKREISRIIHQKGQKKVSPNILRRIFRLLHRAFFARGKLEKEVYDVINSLMDNIFYKIREHRNIESIEPKFIKNMLEKFDKDISAILVLNRESVKEKNKQRY